MNDKAQTEESEFSQPKPRVNGQPPQTLRCFVVPVDAMEGIIDALKESPYKVANGCLQYVRTLQVMDVPVGRPEDQQ